MKAIEQFDVKELTIIELTHINGGEESPFTRDMGRAYGFLIGMLQNLSEFTYEVVKLIREKLLYSPPPDNSIMLQVPPLTLFG